MPNKASKPPPLSSITDAGVNAIGFPYFQHTSLLATHTLLLAFTAVFLPAGTVLITPLPPQQSSLDKPQHRLLEPITANPVWTLLWLCAGTGACQAWWASWMRQWWAAYTDKADGAITRVGEGKVLALRNAWANIFLASALFHVVIILFGAPITSHVVHTYLLSLLTSLLTVFVPSYTLSLPILPFLNPSEDQIYVRLSTLFVERKLNTALERVLVYPVVGAFLGVWVGAFPIPLDWDRPWQAWPLTPAYGALAGHTLGAWVSFSINAIVFFASQDRSSSQNLSQQVMPQEKSRVQRKQRRKKID